MRILNVLTGAALALCLPGVSEAASTQAVAREQSRLKLQKSMLTLSPDARVEQRCNARALGVIGREHKGFHPDEIVAYAFGETALKAGQLKAPGAAFRNQGEWYHVSYVCQTAEEGTAIVSFSYVLGTMVPHEDWAEHYLVP